MKRKLALKKKRYFAYRLHPLSPRKIFLCVSRKKESIARLFAEDTLGASVTLNRKWLHKKFSH